MFVLCVMCKKPSYLNKQKLLYFLFIFCHFIRRGNNILLFSKQKSSCHAPPWNKHVVLFLQIGNSSYLCIPHPHQISLTDGRGCDLKKETKKVPSLFIFYHPNTYPLDHEAPSKATRPSSLKSKTRKKTVSMYYTKWATNPLNTLTHIPPARHIADPTCTCLHS